MTHITRWCSEGADICPQQGRPANDTRSELIDRGWIVREVPKDELEHTGKSWEVIEKMIEVWTCPQCALRLDRDAGTHYTFKRHSKRMNVRREVKLTVQQRQADNLTP